MENNKESEVPPNRSIMALETISNPILQTQSESDRVSRRSHPLISEIMLPSSHKCIRRTSNTLNKIVSEEQATPPTHLGTIQRKSLAPKIWPGHLLPSKEISRFIEA
jgi:hypothetical protein